MAAIELARERRLLQDAGSKYAVDWALCFVSLTALVLITQLGTAGASIFIAPWGIVVMTRPQHSIDSVVRNVWLLVIPVVAFVSMAWSDYPFDTLRAAAQFLITVLIGIWASECIKPRVFLSALFFTLLVVLILSVGIGTQDIDEITGELTLVGVFASKNQLAFYAVIMIVTALTFIMHRLSPPWMRLLSVAGLLFGFFILFAAKSAGSIVFCGPAIVAMLLVRGVSLAPPGARAVALILAGLIALPAGAALYYLDLSTILDALGKDSSLTGRTDLWDAARRLIDQRPMLGVGFQAFWRIGNPEAEELWFISHVASGSGFNFHNLYLNIAVDLGYVGLICLSSLLLSIAARLVLTIMATPRPYQYFAVGVFTYLFLLTSVEAIHLYQFHLAAILLQMCWCYLKPQPEIRGARR